MCHYPHKLIRWVKLLPSTLCSSQQDLCGHTDQCDGKTLNIKRQWPDVLPQVMPEPRLKMHEMQALLSQKTLTFCRHGSRPFGWLAAVRGGQRGGRMWTILLFLSRSTGPSESTHIAFAHLMCCWRQLSPRFSSPLLSTGFPDSSPAPSSRDRLHIFHPVAQRTPSCSHTMPDTWTETRILSH